MTKLSSSRIISIFFIIAILTLCITTPLLAFDARSENAVTILDGETVNDDLYLGANSINVAGIVNGDIWALSRSLSIDGTVNGSVVAAAQTVSITGNIDSSIRIAGEGITISGTIDGDMIVAGNDITVLNTAHIQGDLLFAAGVINIDGIVDGNIKGSANEALISNAVGGDVNLAVNSLSILSTADINGNLTYKSENNAFIQPGAKISGITSHILPEAEEKQSESFPFSLLSSVQAKFIGFLMALITGLILIMVIPRTVSHVAESLREKPGASIGWGALLLFITPIAAIIICITIIGLPVGLITLALWVILIYLAQIPVSLLLGKLILQRFIVIKESKGVMIGCLALGLLILKLIAIIPYIGFLVGLVVTLFGMGTVIVSIRNRRIITGEPVMEEQE
jgi:cytoskeletal protein CcmA (bactofilin family)